MNTYCIWYIKVTYTGESSAYSKNIYAESKEAAKAKFLESPPKNCAGVLGVTLISQGIID